MAKKFMLGTLPNLFSALSCPAGLPCHACLFYA